MKSTTGILLALCAAAAAGCATSLAAVDRDGEAAFYEQVVAGLCGRESPLGRQDPARVDYARLRRARAVSAGGGEAREVQRLGEALRAARDAGDEALALRTAHELLEVDFTDVGAHLEKARALHHRDPAAASFHETVAMGLLGSMLAPGAGDDGRHPIRIFARREQEAVLAALDLTATRRWSPSPAVWPSSAARRLEVVDCRDRRRRLRTLHFDLTPPAVLPPRARGAAAAS